MRRFREAATPAALKDDGTLVWTAAVVPPGPLKRFAERIAPLSPATQRSARDFAELMLALYG